MMLLACTRAGAPLCQDVGTQLPYNVQETVANARSSEAKGRGQRWVQHKNAFIGWDARGDAQTHTV